MKESLRILQVEDDPDIQLLTRLIFKSSGIPLMACSTAKDALSSLTTFEPTLLLLDLRLPDMGGLELLTHIRQTTPFSHLQAVILSASETEVTGEGVLGVVQKPFQPSTLIKQILHLWSQSQYRSLEAT